MSSTEQCLGISGKWPAANVQPHPGATQKTKWVHLHEVEADGTRDVMLSAPNDFQRVVSALCWLESPLL